jgi:nucleoside-diphosphate-sugar epimerase
MALVSAAVIGANGFIGRNVLERLRAEGIPTTLIGRQTLCEEWPSSVDVVFFCAGNSSTVLTRRDPALCLRRNVLDLDDYLLGLKFRRFVHLSSVSVYPTDVVDKREDAAIDIRSLPLYGAHKLMAECHVMEFAQDWVIVRPGSLFGPGLKKNLFQDLRSGGSDIWLKRASHLAALDVRDLADACVVLAEKAENEVVNVASRHVVTVGEIVGLCPREYQFREERLVDERGLSLDVLGQYWHEGRDRADHMTAIAEFLAMGRDG